MFSSLPKLYTTSRKQKYIRLIQEQYKVAIFIIGKILISGQILQLQLSQNRIYGFILAKMSHSSWLMFWVEGLTQEWFLQLLFAQPHSFLVVFKFNNRVEVLLQTYSFSMASLLSWSHSILSQLLNKCLVITFYSVFLYVFGQGCPCCFFSCFLGRPRRNAFFLCELVRPLHFLQHPFLLNAFFLGDPYKFEISTSNKTLLTLSPLSVAHKPLSTTWVSYCQHHRAQPTSNPDNSPQSYQSAPDFSPQQYHHCHWEVDVTTVDGYAFSFSLLVRVECWLCVVCRQNLWDGSLYSYYQILLGNTEAGNFILYSPNSLSLISDITLYYNNPYYPHKQIQKPMNKSKEERIFQPSLFKEYLKSKLISLLDSIAGRKLLMLEYAVRIPINLIIERKTFWEHEIPENGGITAFQVTRIDPNFDQIVVFLSPTVDNLVKFKKLVTENIIPSRKFYPVFWPKRTMATKQYLQSISQYIEIKDFSFDLLPLDIDLYSLQMKIMKELYIDDNHLIYSTVAESIHRLQCVFGRIHNIFGKGRAASSVYQILKLKQQEIKLDENFGDIEHLVIFDRACDFLTPLLKQITYEGLIDEFFGINGGIARVPATIFQENRTNNQKLDNVLLNSEKDYVYQQIRILAINGARIALKAKSQQFDQFTDSAKEIKDVNEKAAAVKRIKTQQGLLKRHLGLNSLLMEEMKTISFHKQLLLQQRCLMDKQRELVEYFENLIPFQVPLPKVLRSMCLQSIIDKGISRKQYGKVCDDIVMTYGGEQIISLTNLAKLGLFYEQGSRQNHYPFNDIKKQLKLINDENINPENPGDPAYAYGGYCPMFTKLTEHAIRNGWRAIMKALKIIPGEIVLPENVKECRSHPRPAVVVYFVGGVTYGEVATIRLLSKLLRKQIIVATTHMINGQTMIESLLEQSNQFN